MARSTWVPQNNFVSGEWGLKTHARADIDNRAHAMKTILNYLVEPQGGLLARLGSSFLAEVKDSDDVGRLIPFQFNVEQAYIVEMGDLYFRFYTESGRVESPPGTPVELVTPYAKAHLFDVHYSQSADVMYVAHPSYAPREVSRTSATTFAIALHDYTNGPFQDFNADATKTLTASATTGVGITVTATGHTPFTTNHVGSIWAIGTRVGSPAKQGYVKITAFGTSSSVTATVINTLSGTGATDRWAAPLWSDETGWPATVEFHDGRLTWGGAAAGPQTPVHSKPGEYTNYDLLTDTAVAADSAIQKEINAKQVNSIRGFVSSEVLHVMTAGGLWRIDGNNADTITPLNYRAKRVSTKGSAMVQPLLAGDTAFFLHRAKKRVYGMEFDLENDKSIPREMSAFNQEVTGSAITQFSFEDGPIPVLWAVSADGHLAALTYDLSQKVIAWHRHTMDGTIESVATIPRPSDEQDLTFVLVKRTINGSAVRYVEVLDQDYSLDSAITGSFGSPTATVTGLDHLEGKSVVPVVDGASQPAKTVTSGAITGLEPAGTEITVGLPFQPSCTFLKASFETAGGGTTLPRIVRVARLVLDVVGALGLSVNGRYIETRLSSDQMDTPVPLKTGLLDVSGQTLGSGDVTVAQTTPFRSRIRAAYRYVEVEDD